MSKDDEGALDPIDEQVVEILLRTDSIVERYAQRKKAMGDEQDFDRPGLAERLILAQIVNQTAMAGVLGSGKGPSQETIFKHLDALRTRLFEEVNAHVEEIMMSRVPPFAAVALPPVEPPTPEELKEMNETLEMMGVPDYETMLTLSPGEARDTLLRFRVRRNTRLGTAVSSGDPLADIQELASRGVTMPVKLDPAKVHEKFEDVLFKASVSMGDAKRTLELLLTTPEGHDMLKLMLYDAVGIMRAKEKPPAPPKGG
jgi:hypothetical protein